jgi:hypothetical protein
MKYFYLTNKEFLYTCNVRGSAHTVTVTDTFPLVFIDALFLRITKGCGLRGTGGTGIGGNDALHRSPDHAPDCVH